MGSPDMMAIWDEMCQKAIDYDAMTAAGIVVGEDGAVRWHGLTGEEIAGLQGIETAARAMIEHYDGCEECQEEGSCADAYDLWMAVKDALAAAPPPASK